MGSSESGGEESPERCRTLLESHRSAKNFTESSAISDCPYEQRYSAEQQQRCGPALEHLDAFGSLEDDEDLNQPEDPERDCG